MMYLRMISLLMCLSLQTIFSNSCSANEYAVLADVVNKLKDGENIIFTKYGDGEYLCMIGSSGHNVDGDAYHHWLGGALRNALISLAKKPNTYIGHWWTTQVSDYCNKLASKHRVTIPWVCYHLFMNDDDFFKYDYMYKFVEFITSTKRKKILISNNANKRLKDFFRADEYIEIPAQSWSINYAIWLDIVKKTIEKDCIVLISGGLCSKVLLDDLTNICDITGIDLGSSFDLLARGHHSRPWKHTYQDELRYYKDFLPKNW